MKPHQKTILLAIVLAFIVGVLNSRPAPEPDLRNIEAAPTPAPDMPGVCV